MLKDPIKLGQPTSATAVGYDTATVKPFAIIPSTAGQGTRTVRIGLVDGLESQLTISSSSTKESKPYGTERLNLRIHATKRDSEGRDVTAFYQLTGGHPKALFTTAELNKLRQVLLTFALIGDADKEISEGTPGGVLDDGNDLFARLAAGEQ